MTEIRVLWKKIEIAVILDGFSRMIIAMKGVWPAAKLPRSVGVGRVIDRERWGIAAVSGH